MVWLLKVWVGFLCVPNLSYGVATILSLVRTERAKTEHTALIKRQYAYCGAAMLMSVVGSALGWLMTLQNDVYLSAFMPSWVLITACTVYFIVQLGTPQSAATRLYGTMRALRGKEAADELLDYCVLERKYGESKNFKNLRWRARFIQSSMAIGVVFMLALLGFYIHVFSQVDAIGQSMLSAPPPPFPPHVEGASDTAE